MNTLVEFKYHIELHRQRVVKLGLALAKSHYPELNLMALESFLWLHDRSKTLGSARQLRQYGYEHSEVPLARLFKFYGLHHRTSEQTQELLLTVRDINTVDEKIALRYFNASRAVPPELIEIYFKIEKVADLVDRSLDPMAAEEFGHPMILASEYIQDAHLAKLSLWLEDQYGMLTENLSFPRLAASAEPALKKVD